jgi:hypothetical protein
MNYPLSIVIHIKQAAWPETAVNLVKYAVEEFGMNPDVAKQDNSVYN